MEAILNYEAGVQSTSPHVSSVKRASDVRGY